VPGAASWQRGSAKTSDPRLSAAPPPSSGFARPAAWGVLGKPRQVAALAAVVATSRQAGFGDHTGIAMMALRLQLLTQASTSRLVV